MIWTVLYVVMGLATIPEEPTHEEIIAELEIQNNWEPEPETEVLE